MNKNYLLQALQYHGGFKLGNIEYNKSNNNTNQIGNSDSKIKSSGLVKASSKIGLGLTSSTSLAQPSTNNLNI